MTISHDFFQNLDVMQIPFNVATAFCKSELRRDGVLTKQYAETDRADDVSKKCMPL